MFGNFEKRAFEREVFESKEEREKSHKEYIGVPKFALNFKLDDLSIKSFEDADKPLF